jgi:aryl-alcohol dehydrogenase-like predicted oxidoreductase
VRSGLIPATALTVSRLSFGTASLHHLFRSSQRQRLLAAAVETGFTHFDTSPYYGYGLAEEEIGRLVRSCSSEFTIASKFGLYPPAGSSAGAAQVAVRKAVGKILPSVSAPIQDWSLSRAQDSLDNTLRRIGRDYLDILYLHEPCYGQFDETALVGWLEGQRKFGKIRYWGLAGDGSRFGRWLEAGQPLGQILQVRSSSSDADVPPAIKARPNQFSYGYLSSAKDEIENVDVAEILGKALLMNPEGSIIVSTRNISRMAQLARAAL